MSFRLTPDLDLENAARRVAVQISFLTSEYIYYVALSQNTYEIARQLGYDLSEVEPFNFADADKGSSEWRMNLAKEFTTALVFKHDRRMMSALSACVWLAEVLKRKTEKENV